jgi:hypothetical protein
MMRNKLVVDMGNTRLYQKPYRADLDYVDFPLVGVCSTLLKKLILDFVKFSSDDNRTTW